MSGDRRCQFAGAGRRAFWLMSAALLGALIVPKNGFAQPTTNSGSALRGVRHVLYFSVRLDAESPLIQSSDDAAHQAALTVRFLISSHSREVNFYGEVAATVGGFDPLKGSPFAEVWKDSKCHQERGYPKITIVSVDGSISSGSSSAHIAAHRRQIGRLLPGDEVAPSTQLAITTDNAVRFITTRTKTTRSRLLIDTKLQLEPCDLSTP